MADQGKEDAPRPIFIDKETFAKNWELTFGKKKSLFDKQKEEIVDENISSEEDGKHTDG